MSAHAQQEELTLVFVLHEHDRESIRRVAEAASHPDEHKRAPHLEREELRKFVVLPSDERRAVLSWLEEHGMPHMDVRSVSGQTIFVKTTKEAVGRTFGAECRRWLDESEKDERTHTPVEWPIPRQLSQYVQSVKVRQSGNRARSTMVADAGAEHPMQFPTLEGARETLPEPGFGLTPADVREIYRFPSMTELDGSGETIALLMLGGALEESDLFTFWDAHGIPRPPEIKTYHVGSRPSKVTSANKLYTLEAAMTVQWASAMAPGARILVYFVDPMVIADPWATFLLKVIGDRENAPTIVSTSWITPERSYYRVHGRRVVSGLLDQAAAIGVTVISAAGDWGAFDGVPRTIKDGRYVGDAPWPHGVFPAVEERVLSVGGTMITGRAPLTEIAWSGPPPPGLGRVLHFVRLASSGGFSREVPVPKWQTDAMKGWYARGEGEPAVVPYGRGFPDVSLMASGSAVQRAPGQPLTMQGYQAVACGQWVDYAGGTSVAAPIWAAIVALMNQARRAAGLGRVGFVNPLLYALRKEKASPFREISEGSTDVAMNVLNAHGKAVIHRLSGYSAAPGWDPATGLGVPDVTRLIELVTRRDKRP
ncbi:S53 family peptidase [Polyangium spumosum]|uniref:S53 family peptidase n=1 Tax=Polyangium spumosum TaxID=889282 RepID=UPI00129A75D7|nr:S53 family peptidase [Polyangium spumosum]